MLTKLPHARQIHYALTGIFIVGFLFIRSQQYTLIALVTLTVFRVSKDPDSSRLILSKLSLFATYLLAISRIDLLIAHWWYFRY